MSHRAEYSSLAAVLILLCLGIAGMICFVPEMEADQEMYRTAAQLSRVSPAARGRLEEAMSDGKLSLREWASISKQADRRGVWRSELKEGISPSAALASAHQH